MDCRATLKRVLAVAGMALVFGALSAPSWAATAAYWRHEEGPPGSLIPDGPNTVLDSSGNGNHMQTFSSGFSPYTSGTYTNSVSPLALRSGLPNTLALDFGAGSDGVTPEGDEPNDDNYTTPGKPVNTQILSAMTVEFAFNMKSVGEGQYQALFGKDGKPLGDAEGEPDSPIPPLKMIVRGDGVPGDIPQQFAVEWIDGDGDIHLISSGETIAANSWYHVAFTLTNSTAQLWLAGQTGAYAMKDELTGEDFADAAGRVIIEEPLGFSVGRGAYDNGATDWADAIIDEVRISDLALAQNQFEFITVANPFDADFDNNLFVDGNDLLILQRGLGSSGGNNVGDTDGNNQVNAADLLNFENAFGQPAIGAVPEPASLVLLGAALCVIPRARRIRREALSRG